MPPEFRKRDSALCCLGPLQPFYLHREQSPTIPFHGERTDKVAYVLVYVLPFCSHYHSRIFPRSKKGILDLWRNS